MPPVRTLQAHQFRYSPTKDTKLKLKKISKGLRVPPVTVATEDKAVDLAVCDVFYPLEPSQRRAYRTKAGKVPTEHQWAVYDFVRKIPVGMVTTYKDICIALKQGSPRSVGTALRNNPFAPFVPCHRIIATNHYIGGFLGEWGPDAKTGTQCQKKLEMLGKEGVAFDEQGYLIGGDAKIWRG